MGICVMTWKKRLLVIPIHPVPDRMDVFMLLRQSLFGLGRGAVVRTKSPVHAWVSRHPTLEQSPSPFDDVEDFGYPCSDRR